MSEPQKTVRSFASDVLSEKEEMLLHQKQFDEFLSFLYDKLLFQCNTLDRSSVLSDIGFPLCPDRWFKMRFVADRVEALAYMIYVEPRVKRFDREFFEGQIAALKAERDFLKNRIDVIEGSK